MKKMITILTMCMIICLVGCGKANQTVNSDNEIVNREDDWNEGVGIIEDSDNGKRFDTTVDEFIDCYNEAEREEHGSSAKIISKEDFIITNDENYEDCIAYSYDTESESTGFYITVEKASDKILGIGYVFTSEPSEAQAVYWSDRVLSCATKGQISWKQINERLSEKINNFDSEFGGTYYEKNIMYYGITRGNSLTGQVWETGLMATSKEIYEETILDKNSDISDSSTAEESFIKKSDKADLGAVFNVTPNEFIKNYNQCLRQLYEEVDEENDWEDNEEDYWNYWDKGYERIPEFSAWEFMGSDVTDYGNPFSTYVCFNKFEDIDICTISVTDTGEMRSIQYTYPDEMDMEQLAVNFALTIAALTGLTEREQVAFIYVKYDSIMEEVMQNPQFAWNSLYIDGIVYSMTDDSLMFSVATQEAINSMDNIKKMSINEFLSIDTNYYKEMLVESDSFDD